MTAPELPIRAVARLARILDRSCGDELTLPQYRLLALIGDGGGRASHLAGRLALAKPSVSEMVDVLVARDLVVRAPEPDDRRAVRLGLTPAGKRALRKAEAAMTEHLRPVFDRCDDPKAVIAALRQLETALDDEVVARLDAR